MHEENKRLIQNTGGLFQELELYLRIPPTEVTWKEAED